MSRPIEDYALISNCHSAALVSKDGSIDWLTFPCFDSAACFASLLGSKENGFWQICPEGEFKVHRQYVKDTVVLNTTFETESGQCVLTDCMLMEGDNPVLIRSIEGIDGEIELHLDLYIRFDYGSIIPWVRKNKDHHGLNALAGPEALIIYSPVKMEGHNFHTTSKFTLKKGERKTFTMFWYPSHLPAPLPLSDPCVAIDKIVEKWQLWTSQCSYKGFEEAHVKRSLITLKALTYFPTGGISAAATTSLPEDLGGERNWDYRYSWIRDSSFALFALLEGGFKEEAFRWKEWLLRAVAGNPSQVNIMYGIRGERRLTEITLPWLKGYEDSTPVRIGNAAYEQFQLDVFGELLATSLLGRQKGIPVSDNSWRIETKMIEYVIEHWQDPDDGIWEIRGPRRHFTHSKVMAWVALKCAIESVEKFNLPGDIPLWKETKEKIHADILERGFNKKMNSFVQFYGSTELDASLLMMNYYEFLPLTDPRVRGTVKAIKENLMRDGLLLRYRNDSHIDGLEGLEGTFLACSFWLVDSLRMIGEIDEALTLYKEIQKLRNDVGLFSEEYSPKLKCMLGNFPQAFSHIAHANSAMGFKNHSHETRRLA